MKKCLDFVAEELPDWEKQHDELEKELVAAWRETSPDPWHAVLQQLGAAFEKHHPDQDLTAFEKAFKEACSPPADSPGAPKAGSGRVFSHLGATVVVVVLFAAFL